MGRKAPVDSASLLCDLRGQKWRLGKSIGSGGFGEIFLVEREPKESKWDTKKQAYVAKLEKHTNGPLFVEINCYMRIGQTGQVQEWKQLKGLDHLGMPHFIGSGSHWHNGEKYRFLVLQKYDTDLGQLLKQCKTFNLKTVLVVAQQMVQCLEYVHEHGYVHCDIKAPNILLSNYNNSSSNSTRSQYVLRRRNNASANIKSPLSRSLRKLQTVNYSEQVEDTNCKSKHLDVVTNNCKNQDCLYLVDYGLASKYTQTNGLHKMFSRDERKAHAGTVLFCSRDAHLGAASRRSDLESLGYNMIYWLTGTLPWSDVVEDPHKVERRKIRCMSDVKNFLLYCFNGDFPQYLSDYFNYVLSLQFDTKPDYNYCMQLLQQALVKNGYKDDMRLNLDNSDLNPTVKKRKLSSKNRENVNPQVFLTKSPKQSPFKRPKLRKKVNNQPIDDSMMNWSKILMDDPEDIVRNAKERKHEDSSDKTLILDKDIWALNPTYAMLEVYNRCMERQNNNSPKYNNTSNNTSVAYIEGYTPAMMQVVKWRLLEQRALKPNNNIPINKRSEASKKRRRNAKVLKQLFSPIRTRHQRRIIRQSNANSNNNNKRG